MKHYTAFSLVEASYAINFGLEKLGKAIQLQTQKKTHLMTVLVNSIPHDSATERGMSMELFLKRPELKALGWKLNQAQVK